MLVRPSNYLASLRVIGFDFDGTLVDEEFSVRRRWKATLPTFKHLSDKLEETLFSIFDARGYKHKTLVNDTLEALNLSQEHTAFIVDRFQKTVSGIERVYKNVPEVVMFFKQKGLRVGVITDGKQDYQEERLKRAGLHAMFDFFYYGDIYQKPDPNFFRLCMEKEKITPHEMLYIGDNAEQDINGALAVGAKACWIAGESDKAVPAGALKFKSMYDFHLWLTQQ